LHNIFFALSSGQRAIMMIQMKSDNASDQVMSQNEAPSTSSNNNAKKRAAENSIKSKCVQHDKAFSFSFCVYCV
jgi:hypothetical protein